MNKLAISTLKITIVLLVVGLMSRGALRGEEQPGAAPTGDVSKKAEAALAACDFLPTGKPPFSFVYGGKSSDSLLPTWQRGDGQKELPGMGVRVVSWTESQTGLKVTATVTKYSDFPATEWVLRFENLGKADTPILENVQALDLAIDTTPAEEPVVLRQITGSTAKESDFVPSQRTLTAGQKVGLAPTGGRSSDRTCPFFNLQFGSAGIIAAVGWSGQWAARLERAEQGPTRIRAGMEQTHLLLHPGEAIRSPSILVLRWQAGDWIDAQNQFRRLLLAHYVPRLQGKPVQCCIGAQSFNRGIAGWATEAGQFRSAKINQELGCDTLWLDAGWFVGDFPGGVGNWEVKPKEFPHGLKPIADECHRLGLKWLLWWEPERVANDTRIARENAQFVLGGKRAGLFNLGEPKAWRWMTDLLNRQIDEFGVDCYRNDFNMSPLNYWRANDKPDRQGITEIRYIEGLYEMWDDLRAKHPGIWLDNCASGGRRIDIELLKRAIVQTRSDSVGVAGRADWDQSQTYGLSLYVPCHATIGWETDAYSVRSTATGGYCGEWDILNPGFPMDEAKAAIAEIKENQKYWYGDYYPLSPWSMAPDAWMAYQFHRPDLDEGMVLAFRHKDCPRSEFPAKLRGLNPERMYVVRISDEQRNETRKTMLGSELVGMILRIEKPRSSLLVRYEPAIRGLTGQIGNLHTVVETPQTIAELSAGIPQNDIDLKRMAEWAMNYLARTPRKDLNYEPMFQCHPLRCPPVPSGSDVVVSCDTDARMNWEWYYMREISGSQADKDIEEAFHERLLGFVQDDGTVLSHPGGYNESQIHKVYTKKDDVIHIWGATKILHSLAEDYRRTHNEASRAMAKKIMQRLKSLSIYQGENLCYLPCGMGAFRPDGSVVPNAWNVQPAPIVEPLVNYYLATGDSEALDFAKAYADGMIGNAQPDGIRFHADGSVSGGFSFGPHSHATMHAVWGVAHLGLVTGEEKYLLFAKKIWDWMLTRGTGTGWFPAGPDDCNETCCISDMISIAALIARGGHPEYFDYVERYLRNYISNLQFIVTPEFEAYYRKINNKADENEIRRGIEELKKFQGGIIGGSGLNDFENKLLKGGGFEMFGCCAPEGMRAVYTTWTNVIDKLPESKLGPAGVYVNLSFSRESPWGEVVSFFPESGRLTVKAAVKDRFFLRPPHWAPHETVKAFVGTQSVPVQWSGGYVRFDDVAPGQDLTIAYPLVGFSNEVQGLWKRFPQLRMKFEWLGNMVIHAEPPGGQTPLFTGKPRMLPPPPKTN